MSASYELKKLCVYIRPSHVYNCLYDVYAVSDPGVRGATQRHLEDQVCIFSEFDVIVFVSLGSIWAYYYCFLWLV